MWGLVGLSRTARPILAAIALCAPLAAAPACAADDGIFGFFRSLGGGDPAPAAAPAPASQTPRSALRPLTVRRSKPRTAGAGRAQLARVPAKAGPVSIYADPTLRGGDAVMTKDGMKVFAGSHFNPDKPYSDADFVAVSASKAVNPNIRKAVTDLNKLPRG